MTEDKPTPQLSFDKQAADACLDLVDHVKDIREDMNRLTGEYAERMEELNIHIEGLSSESDDVFKEIKSNTIGLLPIPPVAQLAGQTINEFTDGGGNLSLDIASDRMLKLTSDLAKEQHSLASSKPSPGIENTGRLLDAASSLLGVLEISSNISKLYELDHETQVAVGDISFYTHYYRKDMKLLDKLEQDTLDEMKEQQCDTHIDVTGQLMNPFK